MKCEISKEKLIGYFYQDLDSVEIADLEAHLTKCTACQKELAQLAQTTKILSTWPDEEPNLNMVFVQEKTSYWDSLIPNWLRGIGWRRFTVGLTISFASILIILALSNFEAKYTQGNFDVKLSLLPRPSAEFSTSSDPLAAPVKQQEFTEWKQQSMQLIQEMIHTAEARQRRELELVLAQFARDMDLQRRQDLRLVGKGLEGFQLSNENRFRRTNEILQQLIRVAQYQSSQPNPIQNK
ncbi:MAG: anti-sigma factor family protein [bacterium]